MGWHIHLDVNSVKINPQIAKEIFEATRDNNIWSSEQSVMDYGYLTFNSDHMEHMDVLCWNDSIIKILKNHKVKGQICFTSSEGDNAGKAWGYDFDGKGNMFRLTGAMKYTKVPPHLNF